MASINASTSSGVITTADNTGILNLQSNGTTVATISPTGFNLPSANTLNAANTFAYKNRIINGGMVIDQRNAGASVNPAINTVTYSVDRWAAFQSQASKFTVQQNAGAVSPPAGFSNYLGFTSSSNYSVLSGDRFLTYQPIEGFNTSDLDWGAAAAAAGKTAKTVTLSFWARSSLAGTFGGSIQNSASSRSYVFSYSITSANTWEQKSITIAGDTTGTWIGATNGVGLFVTFSLGTGSTYLNTAGSWYAGLFDGAIGQNNLVGTNGATLYITGVQLELGSQATSFDFRPYGTEFSLCQRYYQRYTQPPLRGTCQSASQAGRMAMVLPVPMRATPTPTIGAFPLFDGFGTGNVSSINVDYSRPHTVEYDFNCTTSWTLAGRVCLVYQEGTTTLQLSSEL